MVYDARAMRDPSILDVDLRRSLHLVVQFQCRRCRQITERPAAWLVKEYGVETLGEVQRRARCLAYVGQPKARCNGEAAVHLAAARGGSESYGTAHFKEGVRLE